MRRRSLVRKLIWLVAAAVTAGMAGSATWSTWQEVERYAETRRDLMLAAAQAFAAAAANSVAEAKQQETLEAIRAIGRVPGFLFVQVRTPDGRVLAALGGATHLVTDVSVTGDETPSVLELLRSGTVRVTVPVIEGGREVGRISLISDTADLWASASGHPVADAACFGGRAGDRTRRDVALSADDHRAAARSAGRDGCGSAGASLRRAGRGGCRSRNRSAGRRLQRDAGRHS